MGEGKRSKGRGKGKQGEGKGCAKEVMDLHGKVKDE